MPDCQEQGYSQVNKKFRISLLGIQKKSSYPAILELSSNVSPFAVAEPNAFLDRMEKNNLKSYCICNVRTTSPWTRMAISADRRDPNFLNPHRHRIFYSNLVFGISLLLDYLPDKKLTHNLFWFEPNILVSYVTPDDIAFRIFAYGVFKVFDSLSAKQ